MANLDMASNELWSCPFQADAYLTDHTRRFSADAAAQAKLSSSIKLSDVDASAYGAIFCSGGHGTCVDFGNNPDVQGVLEKVRNDT